MSDIAKFMYEGRIAELEAQINQIKSVTINTMIDIRIAAEEEDYDEIISICELWGAKEEEPTND